MDVNDEKRNPADFALWKKAPKEHIMQWDSPWGRSYPGWHIECSTMSRKYLGDTFDIHTGGVDHIPIHHENEIAQSEALLGHPAVHYWMHVEFMQVDGRKMSKSLGNTYTLDELEEKGYSPMDFRYFCLNTHYRKKLNFTFEGMDGAKTAYSRLLALVGACKHAESGTIDPEIIKQFDKAFFDAVSDDLNIPLGLGELWTLLKNPPSRDIYDAAMRADKVLALSLDKCDEKKDDEKKSDDECASKDEDKDDEKDKKDDKSDEKSEKKAKDSVEEIVDSRIAEALEKIAQKMQTAKGNDNEMFKANDTTPAPKADDRDIVLKNYFENTLNVHKNKDYKKECGSLSTLIK